MLSKFAICDNGYLNLKKIVTENILITEVSEKIVQIFNHLKYSFTTNLVKCEIL